MSAVKHLQALMLLIALFAPTRLWAVEPDEMLSDPGLEARARGLSTVSYTHLTLPTIYSV